MAKNEDKNAENTYQADANEVFAELEQNHPDVLQEYRDAMRAYFHATTHTYSTGHQRDLTKESERLFNAVGGVAKALGEENANGPKTSIVVQATNYDQYWKEFEKAPNNYTEVSGPPEGSRFRAEYEKGKAGFAERVKTQLSIEKSDVATEVTKGLHRIPYVISS